MDLQLKPILNTKVKRPFVIAGPCSAESEEQVLKTAHELAKQKVDLFRSGIWKPRTRPNSFEGVGTIGLKWLRKVKEETGLKVTTEVANKQHVAEALEYGIDVFWIGARTTVSPFAVQEIADALQGVDIPVLIKNPVNPDLNLWIGAVERIYNAGINRLGVIHRGFSSIGDKGYRNAPEWQIPIELMSRFPNLPIICDNSHICGRRETLQAVAQKAMDLNFDGVMTEVHPTPDEAWSDAAQQITPATFEAMMQQIVLRDSSSSNKKYLETIEGLREDIDVIDNELIQLLGRRMEIADRIGIYKAQNNISILQPARWVEILENALEKGPDVGLSEDFIERLFKAIHGESINHQTNVMNQVASDE